MQFKNSLERLRVVVVLLLIVLFQAGCGDSGSSSADKSTYKVVRSSVSSTDKGLIKTGHASSVSLKGSIVSHKAALSDSLLSIGEDGSFSKVTFTVVDDVTGEESTQSVDITETMSLSSKYVALKLTNSRAGILNVNTSDVYDINGIVFDELQVKGEILYCLTDGKIVRIDLTDPWLTMYDVTDPNETALNTDSPASIFSSLNGSSSPFKFFSFNQYGDSSQFVSPSFLLLPGDYIFALAGPYGGKRVFIFKEHEQPYDCLGSRLTTVGGGHKGGVIQTADGNLYQVRIVIAESMEEGVRLVRYNFNNTYPCWSQTVITDLGVIDNLKTSNYLNPRMKVRYRLNDVNRYIIYTKGFLKTSDDGYGGIDISWTDLDLGLLPSHSTEEDKQTIVDSDYIYWLVSGSVYRTLLSSGAITELFYAGVDITKYDVIDGSVIVLDSGELKVIDILGGEATDSVQLDYFDNTISF